MIKPHVSVFLHRHDRAKGVLIHLHVFIEVKPRIGRDKAIRLNVRHATCLVLLVFKSLRCVLVFKL